ncbi:MAG: hypothetical protein AB1644_10585 [Candidatus Zixiibacteriota bacterium]
MKQVALNPVMDTRLRIILSLVRTGNLIWLYRLIATVAMVCYHTDAVAEENVVFPPMTMIICHDTESPRDVQSFFTLSLWSKVARRTPLS